MSGEILRTLLLLLFISFRFCDAFSLGHLCNGRICSYAKSKCYESYNSFEFTSHRRSTPPMMVANAPLDIEAKEKPAKTMEKSSSVMTVDSITQPPVLQRDDSVISLVKNVPFATAFIDDSVQAAVRKMNNLGRSEALVYDRSGDLVGIFTERDFVTRAQELDSTSNASILVADVMTSVDKLITVDENDKIGFCRKVMVANKIRRLPVLDQNKRPIGVITISQIDRAVQKQDDEMQSMKLYGNTLEQIQEQSKSLANLLALERSNSGMTQDSLRVGFVLLGALICAGLLQGDFMHDHEWLSMSITFLLGYIGIVFETYFEFNKAAIALLMSTALWVIYAGTAGTSGITIPTAIHDLETKVSEVSEVVFFLLGAMTIVEIVDAHQGFKVITDKIMAKNKRSLMWIVGLLTFFMSAILDNLTTTIVMVSLVKKILSNLDDRKLFGAMIVIAANAGGAWTPIGDVTTTMLWINGQISVIPTIESLFLPSLASLVLSILFLQRNIPKDEMVEEPKALPTQLAPRGQLVFGAGIASLLSVPIFKSLTGLPPYLGMLSGLGIMWTLTDAIHAGDKDRERLMAPAALRKIDTSGVLFFLGILMSVGALDSAGILRSVAEFLDNTFPDRSLIASIIGLVSAVIDNVPLVAATMGMYPITTTPMDSQLWQLIAFCAGTGGSLLVIGSAAGVALMGIEKVDFIWYVKNITLAALVGYLGGIAVYLAQNNLLHAFS